MCLVLNRLYHIALVFLQNKQDGPSDDSGMRLWKKLSSLNIPPRMKVLAWLVGMQNGTNLARMINTINLACAHCGDSLETRAHAIFECPISRAVRRSSGFVEGMWKNMWCVLIGYAMLLIP